jgi:hypothetical protein
LNHELGGFAQNKEEIMNLVEHVKEIEKKYHAGQNLFRRQSVGFLLERISQLEQSAQHSVEPTVDNVGESQKLPPFEDDRSQWF